jgi:UDP-N-acetylmuramoyl-tripeptide--D-alanyl-D-alanine ligase
MARMLTLGHILRPLSGYEPTGDEPSVTRVVTDSRDVVPRSLFMALRGERHDGHDFVGEAVERGAAAVLVERPVMSDLLTLDLRGGHAPSLPASWQTPVQIVVDDVAWAMQEAARAWIERLPVRVVAITGSVGKTSTKEVTHAVLSQRYRTFKTPGNRNSVLGLPPELFELGPRHERAVLEMGMFTQGEIARLAEITRPSVGVVTMIDPVHMERAGSLANIVAAKQELVEALPPDGTAILNRDEPLVMGMAAHTDAEVFTYGLDPNADLWANEIESMGLNGIRFTLHRERERLHVQVPLLGRHSVHTALRAAAVGLVEGLSWEEIIQGLQDEVAELRVITATGPKGSLLVDDTYNASPASVLAALNLLRDLPGRRIAVLGDMLELGAAEAASHQLVGRRAKEVADLLLTVGERARIIAREAVAAGMSARQVISVGSAAEAITLLQDLIEAGDAILVKGSRGVALEEVVSALAQPQPAT